jgi:hypothetical protein
MAAENVRSGLSRVLNSETETWWSFAALEEEQADAPEFLLPLLRREVRRVPASAEQIEAALAWAAKLPGWPTRGPQPLHVFRL